MPLFVCDVCKAIENTACGFFWSRGFIKFKDERFNDKALCSECMPEEYSDGSKNSRGGKWHGRFEKVIATTEKIKEHGEDHFIYVSDIPGVKAKSPGAFI